MLIDVNPRTVIFKKEAREKLIDGANILADAVKATLGPRGRTVIIDRNNLKTGRLSGIKITKDGVTVAKEVNLKDIQMNTGAQLLKKAAIQTVEVAGDGTTTATVLAQYILNEGTKKLAAGLNAVELKKGMDYAIEKIKEILNQDKKEITTLEDLQNIAKISCNGDDEIAKLVADTIWSIGKDGVVTIQESENRHTTVDKVKGLKFDSGYISKYFVTDVDKMIWEVNNPAIILSEESITSFSVIEGLVTYFCRKGIPLLIIAKDFDENVVKFASDVKSRGYGELCLIKASGFGDLRRSRLMDISMFTNADVFQSNKNYNLSDNDSYKKAGTCGKIIVSNDTLIIIESALDLINNDSAKTISLKNNYTNYINKLSQDIKSCEDEYDRMKLKERYANLVGGTAVIKVGGMNEVERGEKLDRIDDAVNAAKCAMEMGYVEGGGTAYLKAFQKLSIKPNDLNDEQYQGYKLIREALQEPIKVILTNAGVNHLDVIPKILNNEFDGFDARKLIFVTDMVSSGIIDPVKVVITALEKASAISSIMLTTDCLINYIDEDFSSK